MGFCMGDLVQMKNWNGKRPVDRPSFGIPQSEDIRGGKKFQIPAHLKNRTEPLAALIVEYVRNDPEMQKEVQRLRSKPGQDWYYARLAKKAGPEDRVWAVVLVEAITSFDALNEVIRGGKWADGIAPFRAGQKMCEYIMERQQIKG